MIREGFQKDAPYPEKQYQNITTIDDIILEFGKHKAVSDSAADIDAGMAYHSFGFTGKSALECLAILANKDKPFLEIYCNGSYFKSEMMQLPLDFMMVRETVFTTDFTDIKVVNKKKDNFDKRRKQLRDVLGKSAREWPIRKDYETFNRIQKICRHQLIFDQIDTYRPLDAIYSLFLVEDVYKDNAWIAKMKSYAWASYLAQSLKFNKDLFIDPRRLDVKSGSQNFFQTLMELNPYGVTAFALRQTTDLAKSLSKHWA